MRRRYFENPELWGRTGLTPVQNQVLNFLKRLSRELPEGSRIAEFGCGDGIILKSFQKEFPHLSFHGVDLSFEALKHLRSTPVSSCAADLAHLPFGDGCFDISYCVDVLEHVAPNRLREVVLELHRISRGPVLLVTPFLESDAVRTVCPCCSCVFSPYYHHNRFALDSWDLLITPLLESRTVEYLPFGLPKPHLPLGIGPPLVSSGNIALHHHQTVCPQCDTVFSRSRGASSADITMLLAPYAALNRREFGWVYEEMGILTAPRLERQHSELAGKSGRIFVRAEAQPGMPGSETAFLEIRSAYEIDFNDTRAISLSTDLFKSPAYAVGNASVRRDGGKQGVSWQYAAGRGETRGNLMRLVFPPLVQEDPIRLELSFSTECRGILEAMLYALPPRPSVLIGTKACGASPRPAVLRFDLPPDERFVTPFGLLVDLVWNPSEVDPSPTVTINFNRLDQIGFEGKRFPIPYNTAQEWPFEMDWFHHAALSFQNVWIKNIQIKYDDRLIDFIGLCPPDVDGIISIELPNFAHMMEDAKSRISSTDLPLSEFCSYSHSSGKRVYDSLFDRITRLEL